MSTLNVYNFITLNGFIADAKGDTSWSTHGAEEMKYAEESSNQGGIMLFGRVTYGHMIKWWPTPEAKKRMPKIAEGMNKAEKIVFSRTMDRAEWENTRVVKDLEGEVRRLKQGPKDMTILGSGSIVSQLADAGLIDTYQIMIDAVAIGEGRPIFQGIKNTLKLRLTDTRTFPSGTILASYERG